jgi:hypothetical protein
VFNPDTRTVDITADNIKSIVIDCHSIAKEHSKELLGEDKDLSDAYEAAITLQVEKFFKEIDILTVNTNVSGASSGMKITWKKMPVPAAVVADREEYKGEWPEDGSDITVTAPSGTRPIRGP